MQNFDPENFAKRVEAFIKRIEGTNVSELVTRLDDTITRIETLEQRVYDTVEKLEPILQVFGIFLPPPIGTALEELPALQNEVLKIKTFVNDILPLVNQMVGIAGTGAAQMNAVVKTPAELGIETQTVDAEKVGTHS